MKPQVSRVLRILKDGIKEIVDWPVRLHTDWSFFGISKCGKSRGGSVRGGSVENSCDTWDTTTATRVTALYKNQESVPFLRRLHPKNDQG